MKNKNLPVAITITGLAITTLVIIAMVQNNINKKNCTEIGNGLIHAKFNC